MIMFLTQMLTHCVELAVVDENPGLPDSFGVIGIQLVEINIKVWAFVVDFVAAVPCKRHELGSPLHCVWPEADLGEKILIFVKH